MGVEEQLPLVLRVLRYFLARTPEKPSVTEWTSRGSPMTAKARIGGRKMMYSYGGQLAK
jgi:hypothetical protein